MLVGMHPALPSDSRPSWRADGLGRLQRSVPTQGEGDTGFSQVSVCEGIAWGVPGHRCIAEGERNQALHHPAQICQSCMGNPPACSLQPRLLP